MAELGRNCHLNTVGLHALRSGNKSVSEGNCPHEHFPGRILRFTNRPNTSNETGVSMAVEASAFRLLRVGRVRTVVVGIVLQILTASSGLRIAAQAPDQASRTAAAHAGSLGVPATSEEISHSHVPGPQTSAAATGIVLPADSLGRDDLLEITVPYCPELSGNFRVDSDGKLALPLLESSIAVAGRTPREVAALIKRALTSEQIMADPSVSVSVLEYRSRTVIVLGAVQHPLTFQATGETTLLDAIALAGGLAPTAGPSILINFPRSTLEGASENSIRTIPVHELLASGDPAYNLRLHGGEEIRIPEAGKIFVAGNVVHPGMYSMQGDQETTVLKALALSQGLQSYSATIAYIYRRPASGGPPAEIRVPLTQIMARKEPDVPLLAEDILYVPDAKGKRITGRILSQITGFGQTAGTGLLIYK